MFSKLNLKKVSTINQDKEKLIAAFSVCVCVSTYILIAVLERRHAGAQVDESCIYVLFSRKICLLDFNFKNK